MTDSTRQIIRRMLHEQEEEHVGEWYHGGDLGQEHSEDLLYVTDELSEAEHYAELTDSVVFRLKDQYHMLVSWSLGQSEGIIEQRAAEANGGFNELFEPLNPVAGNRGETQ